MSSYRGYGQFCPLAKAAEILCERWTWLVVRDLATGSRRFSELRRGIPLISPTMLSQRLRELEDAGVVTRTAVRGTRAVEYRLSRAGAELAPLVNQLGAWGQRWAISELREEDLDAAYLMWAAHRFVRRDALGPGRVVVAFELIDAPLAKRRWWMIVDRKGVELCMKNPGQPVDLTVFAKVRPLALVLMGLLAPTTAVRSGEITFEGSTRLARTFVEWCPKSPLADVPRPSVNAREGGRARAQLQR